MFVFMLCRDIDCTYNHISFSVHYYEERFIANGKTAFSQC